MSKQHLSNNATMGRFLLSLLAVFLSVRVFGVTISPTELTLKVGSEDGVVEVQPEGTYFFVNSVYQGNDPVYAEYIDVTKDGSKVIVHPKAAGYTSFYIDYYVNGGYEREVVKVYIRAENSFTVYTDEGVEMTFNVTDEENKRCSVASHCIDLGTTGKVTVPSVANGYAVKNFESGAFENCSQITEVVFPESVSSIAWNGFFSGCTSLESVFIPKNLTTLGNGWFTTCESLSTIVVDPENRRYDSRDNCNAIIQKTNNELIYGCKNTIIPNTVTKIGNSAFSNCRISNITIPNSVTSIGKNAFINSLLTSINIPKSVSDIGQGAFVGCSELTEITVEYDNSVYDSREDCNAIISSNNNELLFGCQNTVIPNSVSIIGSNAFYDCIGLTSLTIPKSVTSIKDWAFRGCTGLTSLTITEGVESIGDSAFILCTGLTTLTIPNSVKSIDRMAFYECHGLTEIYSMINDPFEIYNNCWEGVNKEIPLYVLAGCKEKYQETAGWNYFQNIVEMGSGELQDGDLFTATTEEGVDVTYRVLSAAEKTCQVGPWTEVLYNVQIEYAVDRQTEGVVTIPEEVNGFRVIAVGADAFSGIGITSVNLPESIIEIKESAFGSCSSLSSISLPSKLEVIESGAFSWCTSLESITIPASVKKILGAAFQSSKNLKSIYCEITDPFEISEYVFKSYDKEKDGFFNYPIFTDAILYVPVGCKGKYESTPAWNLFENIVEMGISTVDEGQSIDIGSDIDENTNLNGNVVGDVYYCISSGDGSYDPEEGCIVVTKPTEDSAIDGKDIFGEDFKAGYTGFVFMVAPGKGTINVEAETTGNMVLKVKVGDNTPTQMEVDGKTKVSFSYDVSEPTMVFIYGSIGAASAKGMRKAASTDALKIYGIEVVSGTDGIEEMKDERLKKMKDSFFDLQGRKVESLPTQKGIYIKDGKKVLAM